MTQSRRTGPFLFVALVIVGCLVTGVTLGVGFAFDVATPPLVVSVVLGCAVASLLYGILGGVSKAGFNFGPIKMGGSAAVLLGGIWFFNGELEQQLEDMRQARLEKYEFKLSEHAEPPGRWFVVDDKASPIDVAFTDPVSGNVTTVEPLKSGSLQFELQKGGEGRYLVRGVNADRELGYLLWRDIVDPVDRIDTAGSLRPKVMYGPKKLHLVSDGERPEDAPREWGSSDRCRGTSLPMRIRVNRFHDGYADYDLFVCGTQADVPDHASSLARGDSELVELVIEGRRRRFLMAVVAAAHQQAPFWSSFLVTELEADIRLGGVNQ